MYGTITMREVRAGMKSRKAAQKKAEHLSWKNAIRERIVRIMWLTSIIIAFPFISSQSLYA